MIQKKAQITYEYLIVVGMVMILVTPFFYQLFGGLNERISETWASEAVTIVADATRTVTQLGPGNALVANLRLNGVESSTIQNSDIDLTLGNGESIHATGSRNIAAGEGVLTGTGLFNIHIQSNDKGYGVVVGDVPALLCLTKTGEDVEVIEECSNLEIRPSEGFDIHGGNFDDDVTITVTKTTGPGAPSLMAKTVLNSQHIQVGHTLGKGNYAIYVASTLGQSNTMYFDVDPTLK